MVWKEYQTRLKEERETQNRFTLKKALMVAGATLVLTTALWGGCSIIKSSEKPESPEFSYREYVVKKGDRAWNLAAAYEGNTRKILYDMKQLNPNVDLGRIGFNQTLKLPIYPQN